MKYCIISTFYLLFLSNSTIFFAQDTILMKFGINPFNMSIGSQTTKINSLTNDPAQNFILSSNRKLSDNYEVIEVEAIFKKYFGIKFGLNISFNNMNQVEIRSNIQSYYSINKVIVPETNYANGIVPFYSSAYGGSADIGYMGNFNYKNIYFSPYTSILFNLTRDYYRVRADFYDSTNNFAFTREYSFNENRHLGFKSGIDIRYLMLENFFVGLTFYYRFYKSHGEAKYTDQYSIGAIESSLSSYDRITHFYMIGFKLGVQFPIKKKKYR